MKSIAYFLKNDELGYVDFSQVERCNPGVGGSEYMIVLIAHLLNKRSNEIKVVLYVLHDSVFPNGLNVILVNSLKEAIIDAERKQIDFITYKHLPCYINNGTLNQKVLHLKLLPWCHNFTSTKDLSYYAKDSNIHRIICVSKEQKESYIDHKAYLKSLYIYNAIDTRNVSIYKDRIVPYEKRPKNITYIGSIVPAKGFHWIAEVWGEVIKHHPDAQLHVIGSGKLYARDSVLGEFGIAEKSYEDYFMKFLSSNGRIFPNVHFHGIMGEEKNEILLNTKVGIPNPSGNTETFGITAIEMQMFGARICTIECEGYLDTVYNGTLYKNKREFAKTLIKELDRKNSECLNYLNWIESRFSHSAVIRTWEELIKNGDVIEDQKVRNLTFRKKYLKLLLYYVKKNIPCLYKIIPSVLFCDNKLSGFLKMFKSFFSSKKIL